MDILNTIKKRRSVRNFKKKGLQKRHILRILEAGRWAPSGLNNQPWKFLVLADSDVISQVSKFTVYGHVIRKAAALILVFLDLSRSYHREKDLMAAGACMQNMLLEAWSLRIGSCWMGQILGKKEEARSFLGLDKQLELAGAIALGFPSKRTKNSRRPLKDLILPGKPEQKRQPVLK